MARRSVFFFTSIEGNGGDTYIVAVNARSLEGPHSACSLCKTGNPMQASVRNHKCQPKTIGENMRRNAPVIRRYIAGVFSWPLLVVLHDKVYILHEMRRGEKSLPVNCTSQAVGLSGRTKSLTIRYLDNCRVVRVEVQQRIRVQYCKLKSIFHDNSTDLQSSACKEKNLCNSVKVIQMHHPGASTTLPPPVSPR